MALVVEDALGDELELSTDCGQAPGEYTEDAVPACAKAPLLDNSPASNVPTAGTILVSLCILYVLNEEPTI